MSQTIWEPEMGILERPEKLLVVEDYEVSLYYDMETNTRDLIS